MQTTALVEDTAIDGRLGSEHGLSLYVQTGERRLLFDMGQTGLFLRLLRLWQREQGEKMRKTKKVSPQQKPFSFSAGKNYFSLLTKERS